MSYYQSSLQLPSITDKLLILNLFCSDLLKEVILNLAKYHRRVNLAHSILDNIILYFQDDRANSA